MQVRENTRGCVRLMSVLSLFFSCSVGMAWSGNATKKGIIVASVIEIVEWFMRNLGLRGVI